MIFAVKNLLNSFMPSLVGIVLIVHFFFQTKCMKVARMTMEVLKMMMKPE